VKLAVSILALCIALALAACGDDDDSDSSASAEAPPEEVAATVEERGKPKVEVSDGAPPAELVVEDLIEGTGPAAESGQEVSVQYVGVDYKTGKEFDASWDRGQPFTFQLGAGMVIPGWDQGIEGMKVGGRRQLTIPPELAYGPQGQPPVIAPNATLVFVVDLIETS